MDQLIDLRHALLCAVSNGDTGIAIDVEKELKALTQSANNLQPAAVSLTFHE